VSPRTGADIETFTGVGATARTIVAIWSRSQTPGANRQSAPAAFVAGVAEPPTPAPACSPGEGTRFAYELQVIKHFPVVSQNVELTGEGEPVVEPAMCGLSVETPVHQFQ
jgi:hypothetical protein